MSRLLLVMGACLLAITLTTSTASADAMLIAPGQIEIQDHFARFFPRAQSYGEATIYAPAITDLISGTGEGFIRGLGGPADLFSIVESGAFFRLDSKHNYRFEGSLFAGRETGLASGAVLLARLGPVAPEFSLLLPPPGGGGVAWLEEGMLEPGDYVVAVGFALSGDPQLQEGFAAGEYEFRLELTVPEPTSMAMLACGGVALLFLRRRKKQEA